MTEQVEPPSGFTVPAISHDWEFIRNYEIPELSESWCSWMCKTCGIAVARLVEKPDSKGCRKHVDNPEWYQWLADRIIAKDKARVDAMPLWRRTVELYLIRPLRFYRIYNWLRHRRFEWLNRNYNPMTGQYGRDS